MLDAAIDAQLEKDRELLERLKTEENRRAAFFGMSRDLLAVLEGRRFVLVNPAWTELLGWEREDLLETPWPRLVLRGEIGAAYRQLRQGRGEAVRFDARVRHSSGDWRDTAWTCLPAGDGSGAVYAAGRLA